MLFKGEPGGAPTGTIKELHPGGGGLGEPPEYNWGLGVLALVLVIRIFHCTQGPGYNYLGPSLGTTINWELS